MVVVEEEVHGYVALFLEATGVWEELVCGKGFVSSLSSSSTTLYFSQSSRVDLSRRLLLARRVASRRIPLAKELVHKYQYIH